MSSKLIVKNLLVSLLPLGFVCLVFLVYNYLRFGNPLDTGYSYQDFSYFDFKKASPFGTFSIYYVINNL